MSRIPCAFVLLFVCACSSVAESSRTMPLPAGGSNVIYQLVLVRHAEKQSGDDPALTVFGTARATFFAQWLNDRNIERIWSSAYNRTRDTAKPLADRLEMEISYYDPRNQAELVSKLLNNKESAFIVGHSNTIPELAALLCGCEILPFDETQYERAFVIEVKDEQAKVVDIDLLQLWQERPDNTN